jgi:hypothetical protein
MTEAASNQALIEGKRRLREFLESSDTGRQAIAMSAGGSSRSGDEHEMSRLNKQGKSSVDDDVDDL